MKVGVGRARTGLAATARAAQAVLWPPLGHLALISLAGSIPMASTKAGSGRHSFVVLIPARSEEVHIEGAVTSALRSSYPERQRKVIVVADNCTDSTASRAGDNGAEVWERFDPSRASKGAAIGWALNRLTADPDWDAVVILDADAILSPAFLSVVDQRLAEGHQVVQGERYVANPGDNLVSRLAQVSSAAQCVLRPRGRARLGGAAKLVGNGMVFHRNVLEDCPWRVEGLAEDLEYWLQLLEHAIHPFHEPNAVVWDLMPTDLRSARIQRARWEAGRFALLRRYLSRDGLGVARRDPVLVEALISEIVLPNLSVTGSAVFVTGLARWALERRGVRTAVLQCTVLLGHLLLALRAAKAPLSAYASLATAPLVAAWRLGVTVEAFLRGTGLRWQGTPRSQARNRQPVATARQ